MYIRQKVMSVCVVERYAHNDGALGEDGYHKHKLNGIINSSNMRTAHSKVTSWECSRSQNQSSQTERLIKIRPRRQPKTFRQNRLAAWVMQGRRALTATAATSDATWASEAVALRVLPIGVSQ